MEISQIVYIRYYLQSNWKIHQSSCFLDGGATITFIEQKTDNSDIRFIGWEIKNSQVIELNHDYLLMAR